MSNQNQNQQGTLPPVLSPGKKKSKVGGKRAGAGAPSALTTKLQIQIRYAVLSNKTPEQIWKEFNIKPKTWSTWLQRDTRDFRKNYYAWRAELALKKSEDTLHYILDQKAEREFIIGEGPTRHVVTLLDHKLLKNQAGVSMFFAETVGKDRYSKKTIIEDPSAPQKAELDDLRKDFKGLFSMLRAKNHGRGITKTK